MTTRQIVFISDVTLISYGTMKYVPLSLTLFVRRVSGVTDIMGIKCYIQGVSL